MMELAKEEYKGRTNNKIYYQAVQECNQPGLQTGGYGTLGEGGGLS